MNNLGGKPSSEMPISALSIASETHLDMMLFEIGDQNIGTQNTTSTSFADSQSRHTDINLASRTWTVRIESIPVPQVLLRV